jgi:hypothetical protein
MNLTTKLETVYPPETHYVFVENIGFQSNVPQTWQKLHRLLPAISEHNQITGYCALYEVESQIYRAHLSVAAKPGHLPGPRLRINSSQKSCSQQPGILTFCAQMQAQGHTP